MNKHILSLTIALAGACTLSLSAVAQDAKPAAGGAPGGHHGMPNPEERVNRMKTELGLTDEQSAKLLTIYQKAGESLKALHEDTATPQDQKRPKMEELMKSTRDEVLAVLTPEQKEKFEAEMAKRRAERTGQGGGAAPAK
jgi:Spy/CpxP family protein refolding chaperone